MKKFLLTMFAGLGLALSGNAQVTFTAVGGSDWEDNEGSAKAFDGNLETKWCKDGKDDGSCYLLVKASEATYIKGLVFTTANDNASYAGRTPKEYTLSGSDAQDGIYEEIYHQKDDNFIGDENFKDFTIYCNSKKQYTYFKLSIKSSNLSGSTMFQISEFKLLPSNFGVNYEEGNSDRASDGNTDSKWEGGTPTSITLAASDAIYLTGYQFTTGNDNKSWNGRNPKDWKIEGSNDKSEWTEVVNVTDNMDMPDENYLPYYFPLTKPLDEAFKYYRISVSQTQGGGYFQLGEVDLIGTTTAHTWVDDENIPATCTHPGHKTEKCSDCGAVRYGDELPMLSHEYNETTGLCDNCGDPEDGYMTDVDGFYQPTELNHFNWLAAMLQRKNLTPINVRLTQDVDLAGFGGFGNGNEAVAYNGEFDGQGYWLRNITIQDTDNGKNFGFFGKTDGANIHDLGLDNCRAKANDANGGVLVGNMTNTTVNNVAIINSYAESRDHTGAIAGCTDGTCTITNSMSDATVYSTQYQAGGLVGVGNGTLTIQNCLFNGKVSAGNTNAAGILGLIDGDEANINITNNIVAAADITTANEESYVWPILCNIRMDKENKTVNNNYIAASTTLNYKDGGVKANSFDGSDFNGKTLDAAEMQKKSFFTALGWNTDESWTFYMLGQYPVLKWMNPTTSQPISVSEDGYAVVSATAPLNFDGSAVEAYAVQLVSGKAYVNLDKVTTVPAGDAVLVKAEAADYEIPFAVEPIDAMPENQLKVSDGTVNGGNTIFLLDNKDQGVGFYPTEAELTLAENQGYLAAPEEAATLTFIALSERVVNGISVAPIASDKKDVIYNIAGQRLSRPQKGLNIVNGKKIVY